MRFLVTGSEGFIGSHLVRELRNVGHIVKGMDIKNGPGQNASDPRSLEQLFSTHRPEVVVHLASQIWSAEGEGDVMQTVRDHAGTTAVIAQMAASFEARVVYASSEDVYGRIKGGAWIDEVYGTIDPPSTSYGLAKLWGEQVCALYGEGQSTALRFSMPYGPGASVEKCPLVDLLFRARNGMPMPVPVGVERSWCWIGDAVRASRLVIERGRGPYNIGRSDDQVTLEEVASLACELVGASENLIELYDSTEPQFARPFRLLSRKRLGDLGWKAEMPLEEGMRRTLEWIDGS